MKCRSATWMSLSLALIGCGGAAGVIGQRGEPTPRAAAEAYVTALNARNYEAACRVSVGPLRPCPRQLERFIEEFGAKLPSVGDTLATAEERDGLYVVHPEYAVIE